MWRQNKVSESGRGQGLHGLCLWEAQAETPPGMKGGQQRSGQGTARPARPLTGLRRPAPRQCWARPPAWPGCAASRARSSGPQTPKPHPTTSRPYGTDASLGIPASATREPPGGVGPATLRARPLAPRARGRLREKPPPTPLCALSFPCSPSPRLCLPPHRFHSPRSPASRSQPPLPLVEKGRRRGPNRRSREETSSACDRHARLFRRGPSEMAWAFTASVYPLAVVNAVPLAPPPSCALKTQ